MRGGGGGFRSLLVWQGPPGLHQAGAQLWSSSSTTTFCVARPTRVALGRCAQFQRQQPLVQDFSAQPFLAGLPSSMVLTPLSRTETKLKVTKLQSKSGKVQIFLAPQSMDGCTDSCYQEVVRIQLDRFLRHGPSIAQLLSFGFTWERGRRKMKKSFFHSCSRKFLMLPVTENELQLIDQGLTVMLPKNVEQGCEGYCLQRKYHCSEIE